MKLTLILVVIAVGMSLAAAPNYDPYYLLQEGSTTIDCGYYGSPCVTDWNNDGMKDLVLGIFTGGNIWFYANENTNEDPVFNSHTVMQADGVNITLPAS